MDPLDRLIGAAPAMSASRSTRPAGDAAVVAPRASGAFALRVVMGGRWSIDVADDAALSVLVMLDGEAVITRDDRTVRLERGDVVLLPVGAPYVVADRAGSPPLVRILPGQVCSGEDGADLALEFRQGVRTWGNARDGGTTMFIGAYESAGAAGAFALASLPPIARVPADDGASPVVDLLVAELAREGVGQQTIIDRLLDVLVVTSVRAFLDREPATAPGWLAAAGDPIVEGALRLLHASPGRAWTVGGLARELLVSRATLAARFRRRVGMAPMAYLSMWRLTLACELLGADASVASVADALGYASPFSFSAAFRRRHGVSPSGYRRGAVRSPVSR